MKTAIKAKRIVDGTGQAPIDDGIVLVEGDTIKDIGAEGSVRVPTDAARATRSRSTAARPTRKSSHCPVTRRCCLVWSTATTILRFVGT